MSNEAALLNQLIQKMIDNALTDVHTCMPGVIDEFDPTTQLAKVRPALQRVFVNGEARELPVSISVPVIFPGAGGWVMTFPVTAGDEVLLLFSERSIDAWQQSGGIQKPVDTRRHDLTDAIAIVGLRSQTNKIGGFSTAGIEIKNDDGSVSIAMSDSGVVINGELTVNGNTTINGDTEISGTSTASEHQSGTITLTTHTHYYGNGGYPTGGPIP